MTRVDSNLYPIIAGIGIGHTIIAALFASQNNIAAAAGVLATSGILLVGYCAALYMDLKETTND